jgi:hypothetical protein
MHVLGGYCSDASSTGRRTDSIVQPNQGLPLLSMQLSRTLA